MKILGVVDGIGSMMVGARGKHEILGNIEWRPYYHTGTFEANFPGSFMVKSWDDLSEEQQNKCMEADLIIGHPECGNFSILNTKGFKQSDSLDLPFYIDMVNRVKPKLFLADNLPKSLMTLSLAEWHKMVPGYKIEPLWVSNWGYGNTQKHRNRLFMMGVREDLDFQFVPDEREHDTVVEDIIFDLPRHKDVPELNHIFKKDDDFMTGFSSYYFLGNPEENKRKMTYKEFKENIILEGKAICVYNSKGELKRRPGFLVREMDKPALTLSGGGFAGADNIYDASTFQPLTIRERARIQGFPDDFIFYPLDYHKIPQMYNCLIKQTGKCMPIEFCTYIVNQMGEYIDNGVQKDPKKARTVLKPNPIIEEQKELCADFLFHSETQD